MTKGLESFLGMRSMEDAISEHVQPGETDMIPEPVIEHAKALAETARKAVHDADARGHSEFLDALHDEIRKHARDIMDLGFNTDPTKAARLMEISAIMYDQSLKTKVAKRRAQMDLRKMELEERKLELVEKKLEGAPAIAATIEGNGAIIVEDRNTLLKRMREQILAETTAPTPEEKDE